MFYGIIQEGRSFWFVDIYSFRAFWVVVREVVHSGEMLKVVVGGFREFFGGSVER